MSKHDNPKNRIKELRLKNHKTQKEVGKAVGVTDRAIAHYEKGIREPKLETWIELARYFRVPVSYLQGLTISRYSLGSNDSFEQFAYDYGLIADEVNVDKIPKQERENISESLTKFKMLVAYLVEAKTNYKSAEYKQYLDTVLELVDFLTASIFNDNIVNESQRQKVMRSINREIGNFYKALASSGASNLIFEDDSQE
ncbi:MAG TPA: helix-turn-helix transcriptional regulator [Limosilactobacillus oris]|uniref:helix-turn-helix transcriptional regulator n=1 Tax=Limosilactobacillus oris TaxID=1632 RepID=UPI001E1AC96C|nr:helix-turn-helix transcriptional regulator [Limosilactobacillus oris]HJF47968.1 helix-turn-helix transcriptional regulator [Limosilactobacillus oris]